jgi:hypothetical protein
MQITRRNFLQNASAAMALMAVGGGVTVLGQKVDWPELYPLPAEVYSQPLYSMTSKQFEQFLGREFLSTTPDGLEVSLVLKEVNLIDRLRNTTRGYYGESFSLVFESGAKRKLQQATYELRTEGLEMFSALMVPTDRSRESYEIIVNHITR